MEALVILRPGLLTPADIGIFLALHRRITSLWRARAGWLAGCVALRHGGHHLLGGHLRSTRSYLHKVATAAVVAGVGPRYALSMTTSLVP